MHFELSSILLFVLCEINDLYYYVETIPNNSSYLVTNTYILDN